MTLQFPTKAQNIWLPDDGILRIETKPDVFHLELSDAEEASRVMAEIQGERRVPVLVDMTRLRSMSRECRKYFAGPETAKHVRAVGLLVKSPLARAIGNFFMGLNRAEVPTKLFTSQDDALAWLRGYVT